MVFRSAQSAESATEIAPGEEDEAPVLFASSFAQERLWFLDQLESNSAFYNVPILLRMQGHLEVSALQRCLDALIERHETLRTTLRTGEEYPLQAIAPFLDVPLPLIDLAGLAEEKREATMRQLALQTVEMPCDLNRGPLVHFQISRLSSNDHALVVSLHHAIVDGWSTEVLLRELSALYNAFVAGEMHSPLPELTLQYADYAAWQRAWLQGDTLEEQITYWREQLRSAPALIDLPTDRERPAMQSYRGARYSFRLPGELTEALRALSRREGATLFMTLLAAFQTLLLRYSGQTDLVVGTPVAGRSRVELEELVGVFINLLPLRTDLSGDPTVHELLRRIREVCLNAYEHQDMPFEKLVKEVQPARSLSYHPIFQVQVNSQNFVIEPVTFAGLTVSTFELPHGTTLFDLTCDWIETKEGLLCRLEYSTDLFESATIMRLGEHLQRLLESMVANPQQHLSELSMFSQAELNQLLVAWNNTATAYPHDTCLPHLLAAQAARRSEAIALVCEGEHLSYGKLDALTTQLARHLRALGVGPEQRVGLYLDRSLEMVVGVLGVLKAGGAYVPLDPDYPRERLAFITRDANLVLLLTRQHLRDQVPPCTCPVLSIETAWAMMEAEAPEEALPSAEIQPENLAYVLYTSGSTGTPKGVAIEHRSVVNFLTSMYSQPGLSEQDSILALTSLSFDIAGLEIFLPLVRGARVEIATRVVATDGRLLAQQLVASGITLTQATPSTWRMLLEANWPGDSRMKLLCGGEALPPALARDLLKLGESLWNLYGPTETTIWSSLQKVREEMTTSSGIVSIGTPLANTQLYVLDAHGQPVPRGVAGELFIGGAGLARGYLNRPDLTAERFVPHPFSTSPGARLYRTGDRVRFLSDGRLEYLGRLDAQVKLRGYRIELGEIEAVLSELPHVSQAIIVLRNAPSAGQQLVAYVVPAAEARPTASMLRQALQDRLPDYMIPALFVFLEAFPRTPNGKVDRQALPAPERFTRPEASYSPPDTTIEKQLAALWSQSLGLERVSRYDNFFEVGGHSLLGVQLMLRIGETFQVALPLRTLFQASTLAELARVIAQEQSEQNQRARARFSLPTVVADTEHRSLPFPLTDVQQAYWIGRDAAFELGNVATHMYREWESHNLDLERLTLAWQRTIARHEMLRAVVLPDGQQQILTDVPPYEIAVQNLYGLPPETIAARLEAVRQQMSHQVFQPDRWPLFELRASQLEGGRTRLHFSCDSLMTDAWSWQILLRELDLLYLDCKRELPALTLSFRDYTLAEHTLRESEMYLGAREYWRKRLPDLPPAPQLPLAQNPAALIQPHFKRYEHLLEPRLWSQLKQTATQLGLTPSGLLLTAFALVIGKWSKSSRFTLNLTLFNRVPLHAEVDDIVGNFTSLTLLEVDQSAPASFHTYAQRLQQQLWEDLEHRSVSGIEVLRELARFNGNPTGATMPVIFTGALGLHRATDDASLRQAQEAGWRARQVYGITQTSQAWLDHQVREQDEALVYFWDVVEDLFPVGLLDVMFNAYNRLLERLATYERWETITSAGLVPAQQLEQRAAMNATEGPISTELLHTLFTAQAVQRPQQPAVVTPQRSLSYQELAVRAQRVGRLLRQRGVQPNQLVAIVMEKGWEQIVGVLGVLYAGGAYLPIDPELPEERLGYLLEHGEVKNALTQSWLNRQISWPGGIKRISVDRLQPDDQTSVVLEPPVQGPGDLAYVIYTSGSTGTPKGVMIDHRGAVNTILDLNERFTVGPRDRVLALSSLSFDLSVYDIFGTLAAGGTIVLPSAEARRDPVHWLTLLEQEHISIWNSVPALMDLTVEYLLHAQIPQTQDLRLVLLSGDWIPLSLPDQVRSVWPDAQVISLGGATEASIWSILFPIGQIDPAWKSIPYGHPMRNQHFYVLNSALEPCPIWVPGELFIGGIGLAQGYWRDEARTNASFFTHPHTGERLYRTGDLGRYLPTGEIEFLGREDFQVKVRGYRIELGEIEAVLNQQARMGQAIVVVREDSPGDKRLVAYVVPAEEDSPPALAALRQALQDRLPDYMLPAAFVVLEALPLTANGKVNRRALPTPEWTAGSQPDSTIMPRTPVEVELANLFREVLGLDHVGVQDNFFALGGHSLLAVQLMTRVLETFHVKLPLRALFEQPTVALLSAYLVQSLPSAPPESKQLEREAPSPSVQELPLEHRQHATLASTGEVLRDLEERDRFKARQPGLRQKETASAAIRLIEVQETQAVYSLYAERSSASAFGEHALAFEKFSGFLSCLRQISLDGKPKHHWGSAGGLYPVQVYLYVKPDGVEGLPAGTYYYHPLDHCLVPIAPGAYISDEVHTWLNQPLHGRSAFSLFLVAQLNAIVPMYGDASQNFCLIEAGLITQVLEMGAPAFHVGLCQVGGVDFASIRALFDLEESHLYLHCLLGGCLATEREMAHAGDAGETWEEGLI